MNVVCINDSPPLHGWGKMTPVIRGMVYTVESICPLDHSNEPGVRLVGYHNPQSRAIINGEDCLICGCYAQQRFRPVRDTSIESLRLLCEPLEMVR